MDLSNLFSKEVFVFMIPISAIICSFWYKISKITSNNELKRDMLEKGMSAEEIERVLNAGTKKKW